MADQTGNDVRSKQGIDIVTRLREHGRLVAGQDAWDAADEIERLRDESAEDEALREQMAEILHATAVALHGGPLVNRLHSWHDLPQLAERMRAAGDALDEAIFHVSCVGSSEVMDRLMAAHDAWDEARRG